MEATGTRHASQGQNAAMGREQDTLGRVRMHIAAMGGTKRNAEGLKDRHLIENGRNETCWVSVRCNAKKMDTPLKRLK